MGLREGGCFSPCSLSFSISRQVSPPHPYYTHNTQPQTCRPSYGPTYSPPRPLWRTGNSAIVQNFLSPLAPSSCLLQRLPLQHTHTPLHRTTATPFTAHSHPSPPHHHDTPQAQVPRHVGQLLRGRVAVPRLFGSHRRRVDGGCLE